MLRREFFIRRDFAFYDSCILSAIPRGVFDVYEVLRRHAWIGEPPAGFDLERELRGDCLIYASVSRGRIAGMLGMGLPSVTKHIAFLARLGWVRTFRRKRGRMVQALGNCWGPGPPQYWADDCLDILYDRMFEKLRVKPEPREAWKPSDDPALDWAAGYEWCEEHDGLPPMHDACLGDAPLEDRLAFAAEYVAEVLAAQEKIARLDGPAAAPAEGNAP